MSIAVPGVGAASLQGLLTNHATPAAGAKGTLGLAEPEATGALGTGEATAAATGEGAAGTAAATGGEGVNFGSALTEAISSLQSTQDSAASASQALATGTVKDPESAVMTVEDAQLAMDLAAQLRTKATEAMQTIFQTQV
jgi:flagellar hook-basal body complex protein FliE